MAWSEAVSDGSGIYGGALFKSRTYADCAALAAETSVANLAADAFTH